MFAATFPKSWALLSQPDQSAVSFAVFAQAVAGSMSGAAAELSSAPGDTTGTVPGLPSGEVSACRGRGWSSAATAEASGRGTPASTKTAASIAVTA